MIEQHLYRDRGRRWAEEGNLCSFGIGAALGGLIAGGLGDIGVGAGLASGIGSIAGPALVGAAGGAALSGITGGNPLTGALTGGLTGGVLGGVGDIASSAGLSAGATTALDTAAGAGAGAIGGAITGGSPLSGALTGGVSGLASGILSPPSAPSTAVASTPATGTAGGISAASLAAPSIAGEGAGTATDLASATAGGVGGGAALSGSATPVPSVSSATGSSMTPLDTASLATPTVAPTTGAWGSNQDFSAALPGSATTGGFSSMLDNAVNSLTKNPLALLGAGGLALDYFMTPSVSQMPETQPLEQSAGQLAATGNNLQSYLTSGTLPPGAAEAVNSATEAAKAQIRSNYANLGLTGSTMEQQALGMADQNAAAQTFSIANQLMAEGANFTNLSDQLYQNILNETLRQDTSFQQALASFSGGLAGMGMMGAMRSAA